MSHVRLREAGARDSAIFDVSLYAEDGEELATVEGFVMRRVHADFAVSGPPSEHLGTAAERDKRPATAEEAALRQGMTPAEGLEALDRILSNPVSARIVACSVDLPGWLERLEAESATAPQGLDQGIEGRSPAFARPAVSAVYLAPRDDIERELGAMWSELLGASEIGVNDDFFELGGQSLVAVRLFQRIGKKFGVDLPMATLFQAPTIAECATVIRSRLGIAASEAPTGSADSAASVPSPEQADRDAPPRSTPFRALVALQRGSGHLLPFFCVHGAGGNVLKFRDLSRAVSRAQPFYGLQAYGVDGVTPPHSSIEQMAEAYLGELRERQAHGPYLIGGYSGGGVVAFEMAQRLTKAGEEVSLLALIDTPHPQMPVRRVNQLTVLLGDGIRTRVSRLVSGGLPYVIEGFRQQRERTRDLARLARDERAIASLRAQGQPIPFALREVQLVRNFEQVVARYRPKPWDGHAVLFRAAEVDFLFAEGGPRYGWDDDIRGGITIVEVPGGHHTLVVGANAEILARSLSEAIERVQVQAATRKAG